MAVEAGRLELEGSPSKPVRRMGVTAVGPLKVLGGMTLRAGRARDKGGRGTGDAGRLRIYAHPAAFQPLF